jgi:hypothetical protein
LSRKQTRTKAAKKGLNIPVLIILIIITVIAGIFLYDKLFRPGRTIVSGFNWLDEDIIVKVAEQEIDVDAMSMFSVDIYKRGEIIVTIADTQGEAIRENKYYLSGTDANILELVSVVKENQCVVRADVSDIYYKIGDDSSLGNYIVLSEESVESFFYEIDPEVINFDYYVYPGHYSQAYLPDVLPYEEKLWGLFFVDCENTSDEDKLKADILGSIYYEQE